jgi:hypothetical protein
VSDADLRYPDVAKVLVAAFADLALTCTRLPADLADRLPVVEFRRVGGNDSPSARVDRPRIDVLVCAADEDAAFHLAEEIRTRLMETVIEAAGVVLDNTTTETGPIPLPYPDPEAMAQYRATYMIETRRQ